MRSPITFNYCCVGPIKPIFHTHPEYEIYFFHRGIANYLIGGNIYKLSAGDLIIMHGMTLHCAKVEPGDEYVRSVIHFDPSYVTTSVQLSGVNLLRPFEQLKNHKIRLTGEDRRQFEQMLERMDQLAHRADRFAEQRLTLALVDVLLFIQPLFAQPLEQIEFSSDKEKNAQKIVTYLEHHYMDDITLDGLERTFHLSKYYLSKIFKEVTGVTIFEYLYQRRINQAKVLFMLERDASVTDVCYQVGFKHPAHFSRVFKSRVGRSPIEYKSNVL